MNAVAVTFFALSQVTVPALSCDPRSLSERDDLPPLKWGSDAAADPVTTGYFINHFSLNVKNLTASLDFYSEAFGLRHIFTMQASEHLSIAYMGHAQGGRNGTGYQTTEEINREKNTNAGLVEMIHLDVPEKDLPSSAETPNSFGHIGFVVPDIEATQAHLESLGSCKILKRVGEATPSTGPIANANGFAKVAWDQIDAEEKKIINQVVSAVNLRFVYLQDPDGNLVEVQPQD